MKIGLIGYGKMGQMIEKLAIPQGDEVLGYYTKTSKNLEQLKDADIYFEFTSPEAVLENIRLLAPFTKKVVIGTTGWEKDLNEVKRLASEYQISILYAANFSLGMNIFYALMKKASELFNLFPEYDVAGLEYHHQQKKDIPSGSSIWLAELVKNTIERVNELSFSSVRCGHLVGRHTLMFDSLFDTITLTHEAKNRETFAAGALFAGNWLLKQPMGKFFTFEDCLNDTLKIG